MLETQRVTCTNCGKDGLPEAMSYCRRHDSCVHSQNAFIMDRFTSDELKAILERDGRVFRNDTRPLCIECAQANGYTCVWCELWLHQEGLA